MPRRKVKVPDLKKPRIRQSWHPINLYHLSQQKPQSTQERTFFQQKWTAKSLTRAYHGEQIREGQWELQFSRKIPSVVPMEASVLAKSDGSDTAAGRGSGRQERSSSNRGQTKATPYMSMTFYPQERRLDTAIFRALFASSTWQARQMVTHGHVKVNGKKMIYPGYLLNPGDMFSVNPELVMYCTGQVPKMKLIRRHLTQPGPIRKAIMETYRAPFFALLRSVSSLSRVYQARRDADPQIVSELRALREAMTPFNFGPNTSPEAVYTRWRARYDSILAREPLFDQEYIKAAFILDSILVRLSKQISRSARKAKAEPNPESDAAAADTKLPSDVLEALTNLRTAITTVLKERLNVPFALSFRDEYRKILSPTPRAEVATTLTNAFTALLNPLFAPPPSSTSPPVSRTPDGKTAPITAHLRTLASLDFPWKSKDYMSAFAFIPRYLEVNQNVCSAVYLRHPVARPGLAEVPSPFGAETQTLAFQWYLRRR